MNDPNNSSQFEEYSFERLSGEHYRLLQILYENAFNVKISINEITKRFDTRQLGAEVIGFIAIHKPSKTAAAYYGVFPMKAVINNEIILAGQSGDTMTHSNHRKKGLFVTLAKLTYEECKQKGLKIIIGQPNQYSYQGRNPLTDILRRRGYRSRKEIEVEKYSLEALRGDFAAFTELSDPLERARKCLDIFL